MQLVNLAMSLSFFPRSVSQMVLPAQADNNRCNARQTATQGALALVQDPVTVVTPDMD